MYDLKTFLIFYILIPIGFMFVILLITSHYYPDIFTPRDVSFYPSLVPDKQLCDAYVDWEERNGHRYISPGMRKYCKIN